MSRRAARLLASAALTMALTGAACSHADPGGGKRLLASGQIVDQSRPLAGFHAVEIGAGFKADVMAGEAFAVVLRGDQSFLPYVDTRVESGVLMVRMDERVGVRPRTPFSISVRLPQLEALAVNGSQVNATGLAARSMKLTASGGSQVRADGVKGERLHLAADEGSKVHLTGQVGLLRAQVSGSSQVEARELEAVSARVDVAPGARLELRNVGDSGKRVQLSRTARAPLLLTVAAR